MTVIERLDEQAGVINVALERIDLIIQNNPEIWTNFDLADNLKRMQTELENFNTTLSAMERRE